MPGSIVDPSLFLGLLLHSLVDRIDRSRCDRRGCVTSRGQKSTLWVSLAFGTLCSSQGAVKGSNGFHPPRACSIGSGFRGDTAFLAQSRTGKAANATTSSRDLQLGALGGAPDVSEEANHRRSDRCDRARREPRPLSGIGSVRAATLSCQVTPSYPVAVTACMLACPGGSGRCRPAPTCGTVADVAAGAKPRGANASCGRSGQRLRPRRSPVAADGGCIGQPPPPGHVRRSGDPDP